MIPMRMPAAALTLALLVALSACSKTDTSTTTTSDATRAPVAGDSAVPDASDSAPPDASESAPPDAIATTSGVVPAAVATSPPPSFTDVTGVNGAKDIVAFAQLGVVDPTSGAFRPGAPIKRREFIRWLVKANNVLWADTPAKKVNLADTTETSVFPDVATSDPDFPYIQGMQDAGYSVGCPDKTFKPDQALTREQMFAIKNVFDRGSVDAGLVKDVNFARNTAMGPWKDKATISKTYVPGIATGNQGGAESFGLVFGTSSLFRPQLPVTRAQAAVAISVIGEHVFYGSGKRTIDTALAAAAAATPTP
jgi:hypothetical protein